MSNHDHPSGRKDSPQSLQVNPNNNLNCPTTSCEPPKQPFSSQSPADQGGTLNPVRSIRVNLPPLSKAKVIQVLGLLGKSNQYCRKQLAVYSLWGHPGLRSQSHISLLSQLSQTPPNLQSHLLLPIVSSCHPFKGKYSRRQVWNLPCKNHLPPNHRVLPWCALTCL